MGRKGLIFIAALVGVLFAASIGVFLYDSSREDTIAEGVTVEGVDIGGMNVDEARTVVRESVSSQIERPIAVTHDKVRFTLSAEDAGLRADVGGMVDEARRLSREDNILARVVRDLSGGEEDADVAVQASYSEKSVDGLVKRVKEKLDRDAQDATLDFPSLAAVKEKDGIEVRRSALSRRVHAALVTPTGSRTVEAPVKVTKPEVTRAELASKYPVVLVANRSSFSVKLYTDLKLAKTYTVAFGAVGYATPAGLYNIQNKAVDPAWNVPNSDWAGDLAGTVVPGGTPENPLKARWMGIYNGAGIHGTDDIGSLGSAASHGCIRMAVPDVIDLYDRVPVGAPIYIS